MTESNFYSYSQSLELVKPNAEIDHKKLVFTALMIYEEIRKKLLLNRTPIAFLKQYRFHTNAFELFSKKRKNYSPSDLIEMYATSISLDKDIDALDAICLQSIVKYKYRDLIPPARWRSLRLFIINNTTKEQRDQLDSESVRNYLAVGGKLESSRCKSGVIQVLNNILTQ